VGLAVFFSRLSFDPDFDAVAFDLADFESLVPVSFDLLRVLPATVVA
jgi:hypothetical protein